jgi:hypothetical protein
MSAICSARSSGSASSSRVSSDEDLAHARLQRGADLRAQADEERAPRRAGTEADLAIEGGEERLALAAQLGLDGAQLAVHAREPLGGGLRLGLVAADLAVTPPGRAAALEPVELAQLSLVRALQRALLGQLLPPLPLQAKRVAGGSIRGCRYRGRRPLRLGDGRPRSQEELGDQAERDEDVREHRTRGVCRMDEWRIPIHAKQGVCHFQLHVITRIRPGLLRKTAPRPGRFLSFPTARPPPAS